MCRNNNESVMNMIEAIKTRKSVRTFDGRMIDVELKQKLLLYAKHIENPFGIPVEFKFLDAKEHGLVCPVVNGTDLYVGAKIKNIPNACVAFGYSFELFVLYAQLLGLGTVWLGGTMNRPAFENAMDLDENEMMPCASPVGYAAKKMSMRESMMRKAIKADERLPFEELFYDETINTPLTKEQAGCWKEPLEMVRLAPSAVNKQPWRVIVKDNVIHFYLKRSKGLEKESTLDMQMIDMGIALCHFALGANEYNLNIEFMQMDPNLSLDMEYVASYKIR